MTEFPYAIRPAVRGDEPALFHLVKELAAYECLSHAVTGTAAELGLHLFGDRPVAEAVLAEDKDGAVGFALFFTNYSTFLTRPGLYLEDLFVLDSHRRRGIGRALLMEVRRIAQERGAGRLDWSVLNWNEGAIAFYQSLGADILPDWRICRVGFNGNAPATEG
jgi:GNAT superfamily N-acetyltransferase